MIIKHYILVIILTVFSNCHSQESGTIQLIFRSLSAHPEITANSIDLNKNVVIPVCYTKEVDSILELNSSYLTDTLIEIPKGLIYLAPTDYLVYRDITKYIYFYNIKNEKEYKEIRYLLSSQFVLEGKYKGEIVLNKNNRKWEVTRNLIYTNENEGKVFRE